MNPERQEPLTDLSSFIDLRLLTTGFLFTFILIGALAAIVKRLQKAQKGGLNLPNVTLDLLKKVKPEDLKDDKVYSRIKELTQMQSQMSMLPMLGGLFKGGDGGSGGGGGMGGLGGIMPLMMLQGLMGKGGGGLPGMNLFGSGTEPTPPPPPPVLPPPPPADVLGRGTLRPLSQ